jgi:hypothetical protein
MLTVTPVEGAYVPPPNIVETIVQPFFPIVVSADASPASERQKITAIIITIIFFI